MKLALCLLLALVAITLTCALPYGDDSNLMYLQEVDDDDQRLHENQFYQLHQRNRRSPQDNGKRGSVSVSGSRTEGRGGMPPQQSVRGEYNHNLWRGRNGATVDANAYYQRNWGGGPRQDYGGGIRATIPLGRG